MKYIKYLSLVLLLVASTSFANNYWIPNSGEYNQRLFERPADPAYFTNVGNVYTKEVAGVTELFYEDDAGNVTQLSAGGVVPVPTYWTRTGTLLYPTTTADDVGVDNTGTGVSSPYFYLRGDNGTNEIEGNIRLVTGANPYLQISVDDDGTTPTSVPMMNIFDTKINFPNINFQLATTKTTAGNGTTLDLAAASGNTSGVGGSITLTAGDGVGTDKDGGIIELNVGDPTGTGSPGEVGFLQGSIGFLSILNESGSGSLEAENGAAGGGNAYSLYLKGGDAQAGDSDGGVIVIQVGNPTGTGNIGLVGFETSSTEFLIIEPDAVAATSVDILGGEVTENDGIDVNVMASDADAAAVAKDGGILTLHGGAKANAGTDGYTKVGAGAGTPGDLTPADDDLYVEGSLEVDGSFYTAAVSSTGAISGTTIDATTKFTSGLFECDDAGNNCLITHVDMGAIDSTANDIIVQASDAGTTSAGANGDGGALELHGGDAKGTGDRDGGAIVLDTGSGVNAGMNGNITLGTNGGEYGGFMFEGAVPALVLYGSDGAAGGADGFAVGLVAGSGADPAATDREGGDVILATGAKANAGDAGTIDFYFDGSPGVGVHNVQFLDRGSAQTDIISQIADSAGLNGFRIGLSHQWTAATNADRLISFQLNLPTGNEVGWISKSGNLNFSDAYITNLYSGSYTSGSAADFLIYNKQIVSAGNYAGYDVKLYAADAKNDGGAGGSGGNVELYASDASAGGAQDNDGGLIILDAGVETNAGLPGYIRMTANAGAIFGADFVPVGVDGFAVVPNAASGGIAHMMLNYANLASGKLLSIGDNFDLAAGTYDEKVYVNFDGSLNITQDTLAAQMPYLIRVADGDHTNMTLSTEYQAVLFNFDGVKQWATGAIANQRHFTIERPTYAFVGASTITSAATFYIVGAPIAGTNATLTDSYAAAIGGRVLAGSPGTYNTQSNKGFITSSYTAGADVDNSGAFQANVTGWATGHVSGNDTWGFQATLTGDGDDNGHVYSAFNAATVTPNGGTATYKAINVNDTGYNFIIDSDSPVNIRAYDNTMKLWTTRSTTGAGYDVELEASDGFDGVQNGGNIILDPGEPSTTGRDGYVKLYDRIATERGGPAEITAVGTTIVCDAAFCEVSADAAYVMTSTPTLAAGADGEILIIVGVNDTNTITLQDISNLGGSGLILAGNADMVLGSGDSLILLYSTRSSHWLELSRSDN